METYIMDSNVNDNNSKNDSKLLTIGIIATLDKDFNNSSKVKIIWIGEKRKLAVVCNVDNSGEPWQVMLWRLSI